VKGRFWLILGAVVGIAIAAGRLPYLAGAGRSLAETAERLVASGAKNLLGDASSAGVSRRVVLGVSGGIAAALPGLTALALVAAARGGLRLRAIVAVLIVALGAASYVYEPHGKASGVLLLSLAVAGLAVTLTGPLLAAPLAAAAGLIGGEFLPGLLTSSMTVTQASVNDLHVAIFNHPGTPKALQIAALALAAIPFAIAARLILKPLRAT
jgi:hypothetical protein